MSDKKSALEISDEEAAAVAVAPRVSLQDIKDAIAAEYLFTIGRVFELLNIPCSKDDGVHVMTLCVIVMKNGFVFIGKSAPASPANFDAKLGEKFAREDAMRQIWPMMGYALRDKLRPAAPPPNMPDPPTDAVN